MAKKLKLKTKRGAAKRFKITGSGKILRARAGKRHLLGTKASKRTRRLRKNITVKGVDVREVRRMLPYGR
ncbi:MAG TPA: 50S ribosomal protein L35 [Candidatus Dormibacteraeota bacterium]|nr:50S ribosomal protein L35 [Candidatus Dormibacteraeota bacterium]